MSIIGIFELNFPKNYPKYIEWRNKEDYLMKKANLVMILGEMMKKELLNRCIDKNKIYIVLNGVNTKIFRPQMPNLNLKRNLNVYRKQIIGFVGSVRKLEGIEILIKALEIVKRVLMM